MFRTSILPKVRQVLEEALLEVGEDVSPEEDAHDLACRVRDRMLQRNLPAESRVLRVIDGGANSSSEAESGEELTETQQAILGVASELVSEIEDGAEFDGLWSITILRDADGVVRIGQHVVTSTLVNRVSLLGYLEVARTQFARQLAGGE